MEFLYGFFYFVGTFLGLAIIAGVIAFTIWLIVAGAYFWAVLVVITILAIWITGNDLL